MLPQYLRLVGLVLAFAGAVVLARGEIRSGFARIRWWHEQNPEKQLPGGAFKQAVFRVARHRGSKDPWALQGFDADSVPARVAGLLLLALGFVFQAGGVVVDLLNR